MSVLGGFLREYGRPYVRALLTYSVLTNLMVLAPSFHMLQVYDRVLASGSGATLFYITVIAVFALILYGVGEAARSKIAQRLSAKYAVDVAQKMFARIAGLPSGSPATGQVLRDYGTVKQFLAGKVFVSLFDLPFIPLFLVLLYFVHPTVALITLLGIGGMVGIGYLNHKATDRERAQARDADADAIGFAQAAFARGEDVRALGLLPNLISIWGVKSSGSLKAAEHAGIASADYYALGKSFRQILQVLLMAWGAWLVLLGDMSGGMIFMCSMISGKALGPIEQLIGGWESLTKSVASFQAVDQLTGADKRIQMRPDLPAPRGHLTLHQISLTVDGTSEGTPVVDNVSLEIAPGEVVALVGSAGSGKSALAKLAAGAIAPTSGEVRLDGAAQGRWPTQQWGRSVGYVADEAMLFPGSVAANIARFDPLRSLDGVYEAAQLVGAHDMILSLPRGYQTVVGNGSVYLSASQRQQIALARAFYGRPKLFVLDHPTAHLDQAGEGALFNALMKVRQAGAAVLIVSRRNAAISIASRSFVMQDGRLERMEAPQRGGMPITPRGAGGEAVSAPPLVPSMSAMTATAPGLGRTEGP